MGYFCLCPLFLFVLFIMADIFDRKTRSKIMSSIRGYDTKPELIVDNWLTDNGFFNLYVRNCRRKIGSPDFYFFGFDGYLFVDGGFWHGHPDCFIFGKSGKFWDDKISKNIGRDKEVNSQIINLGSRLLRIWDCEIVNRKLFNGITVKKIRKFILKG